MYYKDGFYVLGINFRNREHQILKSGKYRMPKKKRIRKPKSCGNLNFLTD